MVVRMTLAQIAVSALALIAASWLALYTGLRARRLRALRQARALADRIRQPAQSIAEVEAQAAALEDLAHFPDAEAATKAAQELLPELDASIRAGALEVLRKTRAFDHWTRDLRRGRLAARLHAISSLGEVGDERAIDALVDVLDDPNPTVICAIARAVLIRDRDYATDRLADALSSPNRQVAERAAGVLVGLGAEAIEPLMSQLVELSPAARRLAVESLQAIADERALPALLPLLETDPDPDVRAAVLAAVAELDPKGGASVLRGAACSDPDASVRARAFGLFAQASPPGAAEFLFSQLADHGLPYAPAGEHRERVSAAPEGELRVTEAVIAALRSLGVPDSEIAQAQREAAMLPEGEAPSASGLAASVVALTARDAVTRLEAVRELCNLGPAAGGHLHGLLRDPDPMVRAESARGLGRLGSINCLQGLSELLQDPVQEVRLAAVAAVRAIVTRDAARALQ